MTDPSTAEKGSAYRASVAVVIPCFRQAHLLPSAIESAIGQSVRPDEIIVVDDGSEDPTPEVARRYAEVTFIAQEHSGPSAARNRGLNHASSDKIVFLDADDRLLADAVRAGLDCFDEHPNAAFVYGGCNLVQGASVQHRFTPAESHADLIRCNWVVCPATAMFDRRKLLEQGGFDESLAMCEDWDLVLRMSRAYPFAAHPHTVAHYVKHGSSYSSDEAELLRWVEIVRQKERARGLTPEQLTAWDEGEEIWKSFYFPPAESLPVRLLRKVRAIGRRASGR